MALKNIACNGGRGHQQVEAADGRYIFVNMQSLQLSHVIGDCHTHTRPRHVNKKVFLF